MGRWSRRLAPQLVTFASVGEGNSALDVGSGTGALASALLEIPSVTVTGVEPSDGFTRYARARMSSERVTFLPGDAQALPLPDATFDTTLSLLVLNFLQNPGLALTEMIRVTRPGGIVAVAVWDYGGGMEMLRTFWDAAIALDSTLAVRHERHMRLCRRGELDALWRAHGLRKVEERALAIEQRFESFDDFWLPFLGGQGPAGALAVSMPETGRAALEAELRRRLPRQSQDGAITLEARAWAVRGIVPDRSHD